MKKILVFALIFSSSVYAKMPVSKIVNSLLSVERVRKVFPGYIPIPREVEFRLEVFAELSAWNAKKHFPYGKDQTEHVQNEEIQSVTLREYKTDSNGNPDTSSPLQDIQIKFDKKGNVVAHSKFNPSNKTNPVNISYIEENSLSIINTSMKHNNSEIKLLINEDESAVLTITKQSNSLVYKIDSLGRVFSKKTNYGVDEVFSYNKDTGKIHQHKVTNSFGIYDFQFEWNGNEILSAKRVSCVNLNGDSRNCIPFNMAGDIYTSTGSEDSLTSEEQFLNLGTGVPYRRINRSMTLNYGSSNIYSYNYNINSYNQGSHKHDYKVYFINFKNDGKLRSVNINNKSNGRFGRFLYEANQIDLKTFSVSSRSINGLNNLNSLINQRNLIKFRSNGELSKIERSNFDHDAKNNNKTILKVIDTTYY
ncbi:MAG: hypothetical protein CME70_14360 [Halobacteriovorax sp.]|nr:hypothetical protein [Halobacteriovorax sp.]